MGKQASDSVYYLTESPHAIHADIIAAINRSPEEPAEAAPNSPAPTATSFDISAPLARIEEAWHHIESCSERIQELEAVVESLKNREAEVTSQLNEAKQGSADLADELAAEKQRSSRAEGLAASVSARANELEQALWDANQNLETLSGALDVAFRTLPGARNSNPAAA
jgi:predicted RNase H-like nuclease (RuvC/YqgF family)